MAIIHKEILSLGAALQREVRVPIYQRPYKWSTDQAMQLLEDVIHHQGQGKQNYRIGTMVFHQTLKREVKGAIVDIVDGQQRLVTLSLLVLHLGKDAGVKVTIDIPLLDHEFDHSVSVSNIRRNAAALARRLKELKGEERFQLHQFLLQKCQVVAITLDDISEAFQFFDSQNARGKDLEPYDLLKAFHLREMSGVSDQEECSYVENWEKAVESGTVKSLMDNYLYRIRRWSRGKSGREFTKAQVNVFKGVSLNKTPHFNYLKSYRINDHFTREYASDPVRKIDNMKGQYPFQIDQVMLNGRYFFDYIEHYLSLFQELFRDGSGLDEEIIKVINSYEGRNRTGDRYIRNLFDCALLHYYDKFGYYHLEKYTKVCFIWSYKKRLTNVAVKLATMDNEGIGRDSLFRIIREAIVPADVLTVEFDPVDKDEIEGTKVVDILKQFRKLGY